MLTHNEFLKYIERMLYMLPGWASITDILTHNEHSPLAPGSSCIGAQNTGDYTAPRTELFYE